MRAAILALAFALAFASAAPRAGAQAAFPAAALIRGENVWLRAEPAAATDVVALLQRGEAVTLTGPAEPADEDRFYPVEVERTGEAGWVRELFVAPGSIAPLGTAPVVAEAPERAAEEPQPRATAEERRQARQAARAAERTAQQEAARNAQREVADAAPDAPVPERLARAETATAALADTRTDRDTRGMREGRDVTPISGPTARCKDGTLSYSATRSGTCSHHGGVAVWY